MGKISRNTDHNSSIPRVGRQGGETHAICANIPLSTTMPRSCRACSSSSSVASTCIPLSLMNSVTEGEVPSASSAAIALASSSAEGLGAGMLPAAVEGMLVSSFIGFAEMENSQDDTITRRSISAYCYFVATEQTCPTSQNV